MSWSARKNGVGRAKQGGRGRLLAGGVAAVIGATGLAGPASAATYTEVNNAGAFNWNAAPWSIGEPTGANNYVGLTRGGGQITIDTPEVAGGLLVGWLGTYEVVMNAGGSLTLGSADTDNELFISENGSGQGTFTQNDGLVSTPGVRFNRNGGANNGTYNLNGGVLETGFLFSHQGTATLNLNGGTLRAPVGVNPWLYAGVTTNVMAGGAVFDTQAFDVTVTAELLDGGGGGGLTLRGAAAGNGVLRLAGGSSYTGDTVVEQGFLVLSGAHTGGGVLHLMDPGAGNASRAFLAGANHLYSGLTSDAAPAGIVDVYSNLNGSIELNVAAATTHTYHGTMGVTFNQPNFSLIKSGDGTQVLTGTALNIANGTSITGGTLQIGTGQASTHVGNTSYTLSNGAQLVFNRNIDNTEFLGQSITGDGDLVFRGQQTGYYTFRTAYTGTMGHTGSTIVNLDDNAGNAWYQGVLWLEKDAVHSADAAVDLQSGKIYLRNSETLGQTFNGLSGNAGTFVTTDRGTIQKVNLNVGVGDTFVYGGGIGADGSGIGNNNLMVTKLGDGTQVLVGAQTYVGGTSVQGGTLQIGDNNAINNLGGGPYVLANGADLVFSRNIDDTRFTNQTISGDGNVIFRGQQTGYFTMRTAQFPGAHTYTGRTIVELDDNAGNTWYQGALWLEKTNVLPTGTVVELNSGKVILREDQTFAGLVGNAGTFVTTDQTQVVTLNVGIGEMYDYAGSIGGDDGSPTNLNNNLSVVKNGLGTQGFSGVSTYNGTTSVNAGVLLVDGTHTGGALYTVAANATLGGDGSTDAAVLIASGGRLAPGGSTGSLGTGALTLSPGAIFDVELGGLNPGAAVNGYDQVLVTGGVDLTDSILELTRVDGYIPSLGDLFFLVVNDGSDAVIGEFLGLADNAVFNLSGKWQIRYNVDAESGDFTRFSGNDVAIVSLVPAPGALPAGLGLLGLMLVRRRN